MKMSGRVSEIQTKAITNAIGVLFIFFLIYNLTVFECLKCHSKNYGQLDTI